jgi:hypothetical protein
MLFAFVYLLVRRLVSVLAGPADDRSRIEVVPVSRTPPHQFRPMAELQLLDSLQVGSHHPTADVEHVGCLSVRIAPGHEPKDLLLPARQARFGSILKAHVPKLAPSTYAREGRTQHSLVCSTCKG